MAAFGQAESDPRAALRRSWLLFEQLRRAVAREVAAPAGLPGR